MPIGSRDYNSAERLYAGIGAEGAKQGIAAQQEETLAKLRDYLRGQAVQQNLDIAKQEAAAQGLQPGKYGLQASEGGIHLAPQQDDLLKYLQMKNLMDERDEQKLQKLQQRSSEAGTPQVIPALQRAEEAIPGLFTSDKPVSLKSVGGLKNLIPDVAAPIAEKLGALPKGSTSERTALQELQNVKIYDSSGKQINESEMQRIKNAMGLAGITDPQETVNALRQMGYTAVQKQTNIGAGFPKKIVEKFKAAGGLAGAKNLQELLGSSVKSRNAASTGSQALSPDEQAELEQLRKELGK